MLGRVSLAIIDNHNGLICDCVEEEAGGFEFIVFTACITSFLTGIAIATLLL